MCIYAIFINYIYITCLLIIDCKKWYRHVCKGQVTREIGLFVSYKIQIKIFVKTKLKTYILYINFKACYIYIYIVLSAPCKAQLFVDKVQVRFLVICNICIVSQNYYDSSFTSPSSLFKSLYYLIYSIHISVEKLPILEKLYQRWCMQT